MSNLTVITNNVQQLNLNVAQFTKLISELGTQRDGKKLRNDLRSLRENSQELVLATKQELKKSVHPDDKVKHSRLTKQFNDILVEYEKAYQLSLRKEREIVAQLESKSRSNTAMSVDIATQLVEIQTDDVDQEIIREQNREINEIEQDLLILSECFADVANELERQKTQLDTIETNVEIALEDIIGGVSDLEKAERYKNQARVKKFLIILSILFLIMGIIGFSFLGKGYKTCSENPNCDTVPSSADTFHYSGYVGDPLEISAAQLNGKKNTDLIFIKNDARFFTSKRFFVNDSSVHIKCLLETDEGNYTVRESTKTLFKFSVTVLPAEIVTNVSITLDNIDSITTEVTSVSFSEQPLLKLHEVDRENVDYIVISSSKELNSRVFFTLPKNETHNLTDDQIGMKDFTVMGDSGDYQVKFVDTRTCYVSSEAIKFKLKYDDGDVIITVIGYFCGSIVLLVVFAFASLYISKKSASNDIPMQDMKETFLQFSKTVPFRSFLFYPLDNVILKKGASVYPYFRFIWIAVIFFFITGILGIILLVLSIPGNNDLHSFSVSTFDNWENNSPMLWLYNIFGLIVFALSLVLYTYLSTVQQTFEKDRKTARAKTVLIKNVSPSLVNEELLINHFEDLYPLQVAAVHIVPDISDIASDLKKKSQLVAVESLDLDQETISVPTHMLRGTGIVFVTFKYREGATKCLQDHRLNPPPSKQQGVSTSDWEVVEAPDPQDIIWANLQNKGNLRQKIMQNVMMILSTIIIVLLVIATGAISQFRSMFSLLNGTPFEKLAVVGGIPYFQLVPTIILIILKTLIPIIINVVESRTPYMLYSTMKRRILRRNFYSQLFLILIIPSLMFGIFSEIYISSVCSDMQYYDSGCIYRGSTDMFFSVMGPMFVTFVIGDAFLGTALDIVQVPELLQKLLAAKKGRSYDVTPIFDSPTQYGQMLLMFTIALCFGVMIPALLPAAFVLFVLRFVAQKYKMIYRAEKILLSDGNLIKTVKRCVWMSITLYSALMLAFFVKKAPGQFQYLWWILITAFMLLRYPAKYHVVLKRLYRHLEHGYDMLRPANPPFPDFVPEKLEAVAYKPKYIVNSKQ